MSQLPEIGEVVSPHPRGSVIRIIVVPRGSRNQIEISDHGLLRIRVTAPPVDGAANAAVIKVLAEAIDVSRSRLSILTGEHSRHKQILVDGLTPEQLMPRLGGEAAG
ncbi:MAG: DUF167 domain-containing protein [Thermomicrobiales bacterium]